MSPLPTLQETVAAAAGAYPGPWRWVTSGDTRVALSWVREYAIVSPQGTELKDPLEVLRDIRFLPWWSPRVGVCPAGFLKGVASVIDEIIFDMADVAREGRLIFSGHSLGGAEALIMAGWFTALGHPPAAVDAYEPPRCGMWRLARLLQDPRIQRVTITHDGTDPIPDVPPWPYRLPGRVMHIGKPSIFPLQCHEIARVIADLPASNAPQPPRPFP